MTIAVLLTSMCVATERNTPTTPVSHSRQVSPSKRSIPSSEGTLVKKLKSLETGRYPSSIFDPPPVFPLPHVFLQSRHDTESSNPPISYSDTSSSFDSCFTSTDWSELTTETSTPLESPTKTSSHSTLSSSLSSLNDNVTYIVPPHSYQKRLDRLGVLYHIQWELARLVAAHQNITWNDFRFDDFDGLAGPAMEVAGCLPELLTKVEARKGSSPTAIDRGRLRDRMVLCEVDREEVTLKARRDGKTAPAKPDWIYGGKLAYSVVVDRIANTHRAQYKHNSATPLPNLPIDTEDSPFGPSASRNRKSCTQYSFSLQPPRMAGKSFRLARRFGSRSVLTFKISSNIKEKEEKGRLFELFVGQVLILFGRTFRALWAPPDKDIVVAIETDDSSRDGNMSLLQILDSMSRFPNQAET